MHKITFIALLTHLVGIISCNNSYQQKIANSNLETNIKTKISDSISKIQSITDTDSSIIWSTSAEIKGEIYTAYSYTSYSFNISNSRGETIYYFPISDTELSGYDFDDFNEDGFKDIRVHYMTNVPRIQDLLLFDLERKNFIRITDFSNFPEPQKVEGTKYYYSYARMGCADMNWDSDLFYLRNFKAIRVGNISGRECHDRDEKDGIYIFKIEGEKENLIKTIPISSIRRYKDNKWGFIKEFWAENYLKFEN